MRTKATILSFVLVVAAYLLYGWALVPLVLPIPLMGGSNPPSLVDRDKGREEVEPFLELFSETDWERTKEKIQLLRFKQTVILFSEDRIEGNRLRVEPCTILLLPDDFLECHDEEESKNKLRQSVVIRTPGVAEIEFDRNLDLGKLPLPEIVNGRLWGTVTIKSSLENSGKQEDFWLETEVVEITEEPGFTKIETLRNVRFSFGPHTGAGTGLALRIAKSDQPQTQEANAMSSARFRNIDSLRLVFPEDSGVTTMDVQCRGSFLFAFDPTEQGWRASFDQDVNITRNNPDNTVDRLTAEEVHLTLKPMEESGNVAAASKHSQFDRLKPILFVANGKKGQNGEPPIPARLSVKQDNDITLVGDQIFYDLRKDSLSLSTRPEAGGSPHIEMIVADQYTIRSEQQIQYTLGQNGAFGKFASVGKGSLRGKVGEGTAAKEIALTWNEMQMEPHPAVKDQIVLKLSKGISARMTDFGTMTADSIDLCCYYAPSPSSTGRVASAGVANVNSPTGGQKNNLTLDNAIVRGNVQFETASGTCNVKQLHIFFTNIVNGRAIYSRWMPQMLTDKPPTVPGKAVATTTIQQVQHLQPLMPQNPLPPMQPLPLYTPPAASSVASPAASTTAPVYGSNRPPNQQSTPRTAPKGSVETQNLLGIKSSPGGQFEMTSDLMRMRVVVQNGQSSAETIAFEGNVHLKEKAANTLPNTALANTTLEIIGDTVTIWHPADPTTFIEIKGHATGNQAIFTGKGIELYARELNISRVDNIFWSPGAGRLIAHTAHINTPGIPTANPNNTNPNSDKLTVEWNREMRCDGRVLQFMGQPDGTSNRVRALYQTQMLGCNEMQIRLNRQIMFFDDQSPIEPKAVEILCVGDVYIQNRQLDAQGKLKSMDSARMEKLQYDVEKNYFFADGPGELSSIFLGTGQGFDPAVPSAPANNGERLNYLAVWFPDMMQGTLLGEKKVDIQGRTVQVAYYPATSWNDTLSRGNLSAARQRGYTLECERLFIEEMPNPLNLSQSSLELTASNSAIVEGGGIFGRARTIKYNQAKSLLEMNSDVTLHLQGSRHTADSLRYNIETGKIEAMVQGINFN
jgi:hypothetical protein